LEKEGYSTQIPPGAWGDSPKLRGSAVHYTEEFKECVALKAQYIYDTYGKFPGLLAFSVLCIIMYKIQNKEMFTI
jgi:hypothetical protein